MPVLRNRVFLLDVAKELLKAPVNHRRDHFHRVESTRNKGETRKAARPCWKGKDSFLFTAIFILLRNITYSVTNCLLAFVNQFGKWTFEFHTERTKDVDKAFSWLISRRVLHINIDCLRISLGIIISVFFCRLSLPLSRLIERLVCFLKC